MIYDCFTFYNELDLLDIRLHELSGLVDGVVLVEAGMTFTGKAKPFYYERNKARFADFPITYVKIDVLPGNNAWERERFQRNAIANGLEAGDEDIVLIGDVDEIPRREAIKWGLDWIDAGQLSLEMTASQYYVDNICQNMRWPGTQIVKGRETRRSSPETVRMNRHGSIRLEKSGWHFSSMVYNRGAAALREKLQSFSHTECDRPEYTNDENLKAAIESGQDPCGRTDVRYLRTETADLPEYLKNNRERFWYFWSKRL